ncbi:MAG: WD40 repeat domain-containing protein [Planctomycetota bacterium]
MSPNPFLFPQEASSWFLNQLRQERYSEALQWLLFAQRQALPISESLQKSLDLWISRNLQEFLDGVKISQNIQKIELKTPARLSHTKIAWDASRIASAHSDHQLRLWNPATGELCCRMKGHLDEILSLSFSNESKTLLSHSEDGSVRLWNTFTGDLITRLAISGELILEAFFSEKDLTQLMTIGEKTVQIWQEEQGQWKASRLFKNAHETIVAAGFFSKGTFIVTTNRQGVTRLWNGGSSVPLALLGTPQEAITSVSFSPQSRYVTVLSTDQKVKLWDTRRSAWITQFSSRLPQIYASIYSPDQTRLVLEGKNLMEIWQIPNGELQTRIAAHTGYINSCQFSPDGTLLVTAGDDGSAKLWKSETGELSAILEGHKKWIYSAQFSSEGSSLVTAGYDGTVRFWNGKTGQAMGSLSGHHLGATRAMFSPDGRYVLSEDGNNQLWLWTLKSSKVN